MELYLLELQTKKGVLDSDLVLDFISLYSGQPELKTITLKLTEETEKSELLNFINTTRNAENIKALCWFAEGFEDCIKIFMWSPQKKAYIWL